MAGIDVLLMHNIHNDYFSTWVHLATGIYDGQLAILENIMTRWDAHMCLPLHPQASFAPIDALWASGLNYVSINVGMDMNPLAQVMSVIAGFRATIAARPDRYVQASTVADIGRARAGGQIAIGFDLEGAMPLLEQPEMMALYARLGVRQIHLAYNRNNSVADGCHDAARGLTPLGRRMVEAINAAGVLMDCSHTGRRCSLEIMAASSQPVVFSHANPAGAGGARPQYQRRADSRLCGYRWGSVHLRGVTFSGYRDASGARCGTPRRLRGRSGGRAACRHRAGQRVFAGWTG
jgi:membrane dipeptidase